MSSQPLGIPRSSVSYRFLHETNESFQLLEFDADKISTSDLKILIAKATGLEKEFARKFDLKLSLYTEAPTPTTTGQATPSHHHEEPITSNTQFICPGSKVIVQRVAWHERPSIQHVAATELAEEPQTKKRAIKRVFPPEFLCPLCLYILENPVVVRCVSKCGRSVCRKCIEEKFKDKRICPFCQGQVQNVIANKALAAVMGQLRLEEFDDVPQRQLSGVIKQQPSQQLVKPEQQQQQQQQQPVSSSDTQQSSLKEQQPVGPVSLSIKNEVPLPSGGVILKSEFEPTSSTGVISTPATETDTHDIHSSTSSTSAASLLSNPLLKNLAVALSSSKRVTSEQPEPPTTFPDPTTSQPPESGSVATPFSSQLSHPPPAPPLSHRVAQPRPPEGVPKPAGAPRPPPPNASKRPYRMNASAKPPASTKPVATAAAAQSRQPPIDAPTKYVFDPIINSWKQVIVTEAELLQSASDDTTLGSQAKSQPSGQCPFKSTSELASQFPILSKKDFTIIREFQRLLQHALSAQQSFSHDKVGRQNSASNNSAPSYHALMAAEQADQNFHQLQQQEQQLQQLQRYQQQQQRLVMILRNQRLRQQQQLQLMQQQQEPSRLIPSQYVPQQQGHYLPEPSSSGHLIYTSPTIEPFSQPLHYTSTFSSDLPPVHAMNSQWPYTR